MTKYNFLFRYILLLFLFITWNNISCASSIKTSNIKMYEDSLNTYFNIMSDSQNDNERMETNNKILRIFREILNEEETINYPFDSLNYVGILKSDNNKLKIYNWNLPFNDGTNKYFGFIQYYSKKEKKHYLYELFDKSEKIQNPEFLRLSNKNWYGALYYSILENKYHGNIYYTLLATDFNDMFTNKKIVEILSFDEENQVIFGAPVFKNRKNTLYRIIFEYSARSSMGLHFDNKKGMIVYDHLSPIRPSLKGQFEFYAPDLSFDGLKFEKGIWNSYSDLDVRNLDIK